MSTSVNSSSSPNKKFDFNDDARTGCWCDLFFWANYLYLFVSLCYTVTDGLRAIHPALYIDQTHEFNVTSGLFAFFAFFQLINVVIYFLAYERAEEEVIVQEERVLEEKEIERAHRNSIVSMQSSPAADGSGTTVVTLTHTLPTIEDEQKGEGDKTGLSIIVPADSAYGRGPGTVTGTTPAVDDEGRSLLSPSLHQRTPMGRSPLMTPGGRFLTTPGNSILYRRPTPVEDPKLQPKTPLQTMEKHADDVVHEFKWCFKYHEGAMVNVMEIIGCVVYLCSACMSFGSAVSNLELGPSRKYDIATAVQDLVALSIFLIDALVYHHIYARQQDWVSAPRLPGDTTSRLANRDKSGGLWWQPQDSMWWISVAYISGNLVAWTGAVFGLSETVAFQKSDRYTQATAYYERMNRMMRVQHIIYFAGDILLVITALLLIRQHSKASQEESKKVTSDSAH